MDRRWYCQAAPALLGLFPAGESGIVGASRNKAYRLTMLQKTPPAQQERWLESVEHAACGYLEGARDPKQDRSRRRQMDLLEAATRVFARDGVAKAKMSDIAAEAGISVSSIYDYYESKEDLAYEIPIRRLAEF